MDDAFSSGSQAFVDDLVRQVRHMLDDVSQLQNELRDLQVQVSSPDQLVTATVGVQGRLVELTLDPRVFRNPDAVTLATTIQSVVERGQAEAERKEAEIRRRAMPQAEQIGRSAGIDIHEVLRPFEQVMPKEDRDG
jgi:DNA-binding protein YbaB